MGILAITPPHDTSGLRGASFACVLHLLCSLVVLADFAYTWPHQRLTARQQMLAVGCLGWLLANGGLWIRLRAGRLSATSVLRLLVPGLAVVLALAASEAGLRAWNALFPPVKFQLMSDAQAKSIFFLRAWNALFPPVKSLYTPGSRFVSMPEPTLMSGVSGPATFTVNEIGLRGPSVRILEDRRNVYRIVTVGGSTTQCLFLDDSEAWPYLLMESLNDRQNRRFVYVGNTGVAGHATADHLKLLEEMPVLHEVDLLVFLIGINDLISTLRANGASTRPHRDSQGRLLLEQPFIDEVPAHSLPLYTRLRFYRLVVSARQRAAELPPFRGNAKWYAEARRERAAGPRADLPDLTIGAREYRDRIDGLGRLCRSLGRRCLFLTQPTLWRADLTPEEEAALWFGVVGRGPQTKGFASTADLAKGMHLFNQILLTACREDGLECYDLAAAFPKDLSVFYDDCHLNEAGARRVAQLLTDYLLGRAPFGDPS